MFEEIDNKKAKLEISMLSPERILELSSGEVESSETINYRFYHPASSGLFSEKVFGPVYDWECRCGKYKKRHYKGLICENCGVEITSSRVRRERFGHIELGCKVVMPQYLFGAPSILATVMDIPQSYLERIVFQNLHIDIHKFWTLDNKLEAIDVSTSDEKTECGTNGIYEVLKLINIQNEIDKISKNLRGNSGYLAFGFLHRKEVLEAFKASKNKPEWMIASRLLVLPAGLRPILEYKGKVYVSGINDRYRLIIQRARLLDQFMMKPCPKAVIEAQIRMIQIAVDALFDSNLEMEEYQKTIADSLVRRFQNRIEHNVDYSARGQVVPDSKVGIEEIGLPYDVAKVLFKPLLVKRIYGRINNAKSASKMADYLSETTMKALMELEKSFVIVASLWTGELVAFRIKLVDDDFFKINPIVYEMFDMGVSDEASIIKAFAQLDTETAKESLAKIGIRSLVVSPYTDRVQLLPNHSAMQWLSKMSRVVEDNGRRFISKGEVYCAYANKSITVNELVDIRCQTNNGFEYHEKTTIGRLVINEFLPQNMGVINRAGFKNKFLLEHNYEFDENKAEEICEDIYDKFGVERYLEFISALYASMSNYGHSLMLDLKPSEKVVQIRYDIQADVKALRDVKKYVRGMKLGVNDYEKTSLSIDYKSEFLQGFCFDFLRNRRLASDVYAFEEIIASDGEIITASLLKKLQRHGVKEVKFYTGFLNANGEYSDYAYGKKVDYNPFMMALLSLQKSLHYLTPDSANTLFSILRADDYLQRNKTLERILNINEGEIGRFYERIVDKGSAVLQLNRLKGSETLVFRSYLVYSLFEMHNIKISLRQVGLLIETQVFSKINLCNENEVLVRSNDYLGLNVIGEVAVKPSQIDLTYMYTRKLFERIEELS